MIPWRVDVPQEQAPYMNWLIIAAIVVVFLLQVFTVFEFVVEAGMSGESDAIEKSFMTKMVLDDWSVVGLFGHMWLHGGLWHLLGNLLFLWIFGNAVCAKIGNLLYLSLYLAFGLIAGISHLIFQDGAVVGASGAIYGVVGMFLIFFPENNITCYSMAFLLPLEYTLSSIWVILMWVGFDIWGASKGGGMVAYFAHLGGFAGGVAVAIYLLKSGKIAMERYERSLLDWIGEFRGRSEQSSSSYDPRYPGLERDLGFARDAEAGAGLGQAVDTSPPQQQLSDEDFFQREAKPEFIRFSCSCGKRVKIPAKYAGQTGKCPQCQRRLKIPET